MTLTNTIKRAEHIKLDSGVKKKWPKVSIVIINWNSLKNITECLESLRGVDYPHYEIIVVDNASTDDSAGQVKRLFPEITLMKSERNLGFSGGNNIGMKLAMKNGADFVWLLNMVAQ